MRRVLPDGVRDAGVSGSFHSSVFRGLHGAQIPEDVHHVVVAEEHDDPPARWARLLLEAHQEVEHRARLDAAIEDIAHLDEDTSATGPVGGTVQEPSHGQDAHQVVVGSVDVADRNDTWGAGDPASALRGEHGRDEGERRDREEAECEARGQTIEEAQLHDRHRRLHPPSAMIAPTRPVPSAIMMTPALQLPYPA